MSFEGHEAGMMWRVGDVIVVSNSKAIHRLGPPLFNSGFTARFVTFDGAIGPTGHSIVIVDGRSSIERALAFVQQLDPANRDRVVLIADPREPFVYRRIRSVCSGVVLYAPVDPDQLVDVLHNLVARRSRSIAGPSYGARPAS
jgi:hypothetical protein